MATVSVNCLLTWVLHYFATSARALVALVVAPHDAALPWTNCNNAWNTPRCADRKNASGQVGVLPSLLSTSVVDALLTYVRVSALMQTADGNVSALTRRSPAEEYYLFGVLNVSSGKCLTE